MTPVPLHPATRLLLWINWVVAAFVLPPPVVLASLPLSLFLGGQLARRRWWRLAWRSRWLVLAILLAISLSVPGEYLIPGYPGTHEGLAAALDQIVRLLASLAAVAWLLAAKRSELVGAIYGIGVALGGRRAGAGLERFALRVTLVFELVEDRRVHWKDLLACDSAEVSGVDLAIELHPVAARDRLVNLLAVTALLFAVVWVAR